MAEFKTKISNQNAFKPNISLYVDGASRIKSNKIDENTLGAYSYYLSHQGREKSDTVVTQGRTNNYNEIMALYFGLSQLKSHDVSVVAYSDSAYVVDCIQKGWWKKWERDGWTKEGGLRNAEQWKSLIELIKVLKYFEIKKVKGHSNNEGNNFVDFLNNKAMDAFIDGKSVKLEG